MDEKPNTDEFLARRFAEERPRLRGVAYRVLGSAADADDALQEAWLRLARADTSSVDNLSAWLTTVVVRVSLNILRSRRAQREEPLEVGTLGAVGDLSGVDPEEEALLADSVGLALLVVLDNLSPAERLAFVLHDLFDVPFVEIASIVGRSSDATRQLASRARRRVRGAGAGHPPDRSRRRRVVGAYLDAIRSGDLESLVRLLDPEVELRSDPAATPSGRAMKLRGAEVVARSELASAGRALFTGVALVDGDVGLVMAPQNKVVIALTFDISDADLITSIDVIADPERVARLDVGII